MTGLILEILYGCGLRVSEAVGRCISHVYLDESFVRVVGARAQGEYRKLFGVDGPPTLDLAVEYALLEARMPTHQLGFGQ